MAKLGPPSHWSWPWYCGRTRRRRTRRPIYHADLVGVTWKL